MEDNTNVTENVTENVEQETTEKTYTKKDIDDSFNAGVRKANSEWQKDEKYKEFLEWKKTSQSDSDKINELQASKDELEADKNNLTKELAYLKAQIQVNNSDVKKEFSKFVTSEVLELVNDTTDFESALKGYKKENPQYFGEVVVKKVQTSPNLTGGDNQPQNTNSIMNDILRSNRN